jgi:ribosomal protein S18 acetylase RimI-like enzyme
MHEGRIIGYCFCVYEGNKSVIGDIFVLPDTSSRLAITHTLTCHLLEVLEASPDIDRIEAQLLLYDVGVLAQPFLKSGFSIYPRLFLECELTQQNLPLPDPAPLSIEICPWTPGYYQPSAELIHSAYLGHIDSKINDQYRTLHGSLRFLHNIVRFPGCGVFDPEASWVLRDRHTKKLVGVILCSRVAVGVAHVTQICITPELRGKAIGRLLLLHSMHRLRARGYTALTLTVSEENHSAVRLYMGAGFTMRLRFEALVLEKKASVPRVRVQLPVPPDRRATPPESSPKEPLGFFGFARAKPTPTRN